MKGEINESWYCVSGIAKDCPDRIESYDCTEAHRKWPTPEQFKEEYGEDYPNDCPIWYSDTGDFWNIGYYGDVVDYDCKFTVCVCTPWGKPPNDWRPE